MIVSSELMTQRTCIFTLPSIRNRVEWYERGQTDDFLEDWLVDLSMEPNDGHFWPSGCVRTAFPLSPLQYLALLRKYPKHKVEQTLAA